MSEYSEKRSKQIREEIQEKCFEAMRDADWWAAHCDEIKTEEEIIKEANRRYISFYERDKFIREAEECFMLITYRRKNG